jgi:PKD repeat protein
MVRSILRPILVLAMVVAVALSSTPVAFAAPANDNFADAIIITTLPFSDEVSNIDATSETDEPRSCGVSTRTVWYMFTATAARVLKVDMAGSSFGDTPLAIYRASGASFADLTTIACMGWGEPLAFQVQAGTTYYLQAADYSSGGGTLRVHLEELTPPPNDEFINAQVIGELPFEASVDTTAATKEPLEPASPCGPSIEKTVWFAFTPKTSGSYSASGGYNLFTHVLAIYTVSAIDDLELVVCSPFPFWNLVTAQLQAGVTYYYQLGASVDGSQQTSLRLDVTPAPRADFSYQPSDPSIYDSIQFADSSYDPGGMGFKTWLWDLGDGTTSSEYLFAHTYAKDGDYPVVMTVTTNDGRTGTISKTVQVKTHDVAITRFLAPKSARSGQTRQISVYVNSQRYDETVAVQLFKGSAQSQEWIGSLQLLVPGRPNTRTTRFDFSYTFTPDDARIGKVTFLANANLASGRDALPFDNEAMSLPVKVMK